MGSVQRRWARHQFASFQKEYEAAQTLSGVAPKKISPNVKLFTFYPKISPTHFSFLSASLFFIFLLVPQGRQNSATLHAGFGTLKAWLVFGAATIKRTSVIMEFFRLFSPTRCFLIYFLFCSSGSVSGSLKCSPLRWLGPNPNC